MIPKTIHYCWFGKNPKNKLILRCIESWKKYLPEYEIIEWNEESFDIDMHPFTQKAYKEKHWAFVADYARIWVLKEYGGIYLDTDMEVIKSLDPLLECKFFIGKESQKYIGAGIIGASRHCQMMNELIDIYDHLHGYKTIPTLITPIIEKYQKDKDICVYDEEYFYPFYPFGENKNMPLMYSDITRNTFTIHHWEGSWDDSIIQSGTGICMRLKRIFQKALGQ